jgi:hypothetical protein
VPHQSPLLVRWPCYAMTKSSMQNKKSITIILSNHLLTCLLCSLKSNVNLWKV